jgi:hypothetical protein
MNRGGDSSATTGSSGMADGTADGNFAGCSKGVAAVCFSVSFALSAVAGALCCGGVLGVKKKSHSKKIKKESAMAMNIRACSIFVSS